MTHILIADDEGPKLTSLISFVEALLPDFQIESTRSVRSTIESMRKEQPFLLVLDMSLPTFEIAPGEPGGRPQGFGGSEVLRFMEFYGVECPVIVVTQYEEFSDKDRHVNLSSITHELLKEHPTNFRGCVYYSSLTDEWKPKLAALVNEVMGAK